MCYFMTHGILFSKRKPFTDFKDTLRDWSDYVVMYLARGTTLKELYLDPELLSEEQWKVLGLAANWAVRSQRRLMNTVYVGGDPERGEGYGYVSWVAGRGILTLRNPDRARQTIKVPFDGSVYHRGPSGRAWRARAIYPFVEPMPWPLTSGRAFDVAVPGESVHVFELEPGEPGSDRAVQPAPLPAARAAVTGDAFELTLRVPDEAMARYDLVVQTGAPVAAPLRIDGALTPPSRSHRGKRWGLHAYDLRSRRGRTVTIAGRLVSPEGAPRLRPDRKVLLDVYVLADRPVAAPEAGDAAGLPFPIAQHNRRQTQHLIAAKAVRVQGTSDTNRKQSP